MTKSEKVFNMLRLIADAPGKLGPKDLAEQLSVSERAIYRYTTTLAAAGIMVRFKGNGYILQDEFWLNFLTRHRVGTSQPKSQLIALLTAAVKFVEDEALCEQGKKFLALLGVAHVG